MFLVYIGRTVKHRTNVKNSTNIDAVFQMVRKGPAFWRKKCAIGQNGYVLQMNRVLPVISLKVLF